MAKGDGFPSELCTPRRVGLVLALAGTGLVSAFVVLAVRNLLHATAVLPSSLWVSGSMVPPGMPCTCWRPFSRAQVLAVRNVADLTALEVGFRLFGTNMIVRRIPARDPLSIGWSRGEASDMAARGRERLDGLVLPS